MNTHSLVLEHIGRAAIHSTAGATTPATGVAGDPAAIRYSVGRAFIMAAWARTQFAGKVQIHSPNMANDITGVRSLTSAGGLVLAWPDPALQEVQKQDTINVDFVDVGDAAGDIENYGQLNYYMSFGSTGNGRYLTEQETIQSSVNLLTLEFTLSGLTPVAAGYYGETAFDKGLNDLLKANTDYAILGYNFLPAAGKCNSIVFRGPDTGNYRVGGPAVSVTETGAFDTSKFFLQLARRHKFPGVPVFNSANKSGTTVAVMPDENFTGGVITVFLAELV